MIDPVAALALRLALAALFAGAAWHKARDLEAFAAALADYRLLPGFAVRAGARALALAEAGAAALLLARPGAGAACATALLALYSAAIGVNLARGRRHIDCGCSGPALRQPLSFWLLARNVLLLAAALVLLLPVGGRALGGLDLANAVAASATAGFLYAAANRLLAEAPALARLREHAS